MDLRDLVRRSLGDPSAEIAEQRSEDVPAHGSGALSTISLRRLHGTTTAGLPWSFVVKSIESPRRRPGMEELAAHFPWRVDLDTYLAGFALPDGLRLPRLHHVEDLGGDRYVMWLEDIRTADAPWDLDRYRSAARLLGELAAMHPAAGPNEGLRHYLGGPVEHVFLPALRDPDLWRHPLVAAYADPLLRSDLLALAARIEPLVAAVAELPHTLSHGDASPGNLLVPADGSARFVAIDWSWPYATCAGFDLCQLLVGRAHSGELTPAELPAVHEAIEAAYVEGSGFSADDVAYGYAATLVLVAAWTTLPLDRLADEPTPEVHELFRRRAGLARFVADLGRGL
ncbi:phosphotransferase [Nonomuraea sp. NPDC003804]|uniref:phosphotransferase n=1 Tax=Nonomuraea sp. NPDC003804 TaxID=3154547 RepID=UPI0033AEF480